MYVLYLRSKELNENPTWILTNGIWNDYSIWVDTAIWED